MTYARLFYELFGVGALDWDRMMYVDFLWMKEAADEEIRKDAAAAAAAKTPNARG